MAANTRNATQGARGHNFENVNVNDDALALLGDIHVHNVAGLSPQEQEKAARRQLMEWLAYDNMGARRMQLAQNAAQHVEWIWKEQAQGGPGFVEWLKDETPMFWVSGKPGSGKSTLMKFVSESAKLPRLIRPHPDRKWLIVHFYFDFRVGSGVANAIDGLLRSMLFQLAKQSTHAADAIRHDPKGADYEMRHFHLDRQDLFHLFQVATQAIASSHEICVFVDGLDEFSGQYRELVRFLESLTRHGITKLCLASRPEFELTQYLAYHPQLKMQFHNSETIHAYVTGVLQQIPCGLSVSVNLNDLARNIVKAAEGVILWAHLVCSYLIKSIMAGETEEEVYRVLNEFPKEMNAVYERLLDAIEPSKRLESAVFLHLIKSAKEKIYLWDLHCAMVFLRSLGKLPCWPQQPLSCDTFVHRLRSRTGSLVDIVGNMWSALGRKKSVKHNKVTYAQLFHKTLDTYLTTSGWSRTILIQATPSILPDNLWLDMCQQCLLRNEIPDEAAKKLLQTSPNNRNGSLYGLPDTLLPDMFVSDKLYSIMMRTNNITGELDFLDYALAMLPQYTASIVQNVGESTDSCHRVAMGLNIMLLHPWTVQIPSKITDYRWNLPRPCICYHNYSPFIWHRWRHLHFLAPVQRAAIFALLHDMYLQFAEWSTGSANAIDRALSREVFRVLKILVIDQLYARDDPKGPKLAPIVGAIPKFAPFVEDWELASLIAIPKLTRFVNQVLTAVFETRLLNGIDVRRTFSVDEKTLGSLPATCKPIHGQKEYNLLAIWLWGTSFRYGSATEEGSLRDNQLAILLRSGLDINEWCGPAGPPLHHVLVRIPGGEHAWNESRIRCLLRHGADVTLPGPYGTPLDLARQSAAAYFVEGPKWNEDPGRFKGNDWDVDTLNGDTKNVLQLLEMAVASQGSLSE